MEDDPEIEGTLADGTVVGIKATGRDFFVGRVLYEDTSGGGRRQVGWMGTMLDHPEEESIVNVVDMHYFSADNRWVLDTQFLHSNNRGESGLALPGILGIVQSEVSIIVYALRISMIHLT